MLRDRRFGASPLGTSTEREDEAHGSFDLVSAFAAPLPIAVISDLLGVPRDRAADFARFGATIGSALDGIRSLTHARDLMAANSEFEKLFTDLFALRRSEPSDDIVSAIAAQQGDQVRPGGMLSLCVQLLIAGFETTVNLISNAVLALLDHRDRWTALCADPALGVANRDPDVYDEPSRFDVTRTRSVEHLAFPAGFTIASANRWRASKPRSRCRRWPSGCRRCVARDAPRAETRQRSADRSGCQ